MLTTGGPRQKTSIGIEKLQVLKFSYPCNVEQNVATRIINKKVACHKGDGEGNKKEGCPTKGKQPFQAQRPLPLLDETAALG